MAQLSIRWSVIGRGLLEPRGADVEPGMQPNHDFNSEHSSGIDESFVVHVEPNSDQDCLKLAQAGLTNV